MLSVLIKDNHEPNVIKLTYENLWKELKDLESELIVTDDWISTVMGLEAGHENFVCLVEADCLVSSGYFSSQIGLFKKNPFNRKLAVMSSSTAVNDSSNRIYGYSIGSNYSDGVIPNRDKISNVPYAVQIGYMPGSVIRLRNLQSLFVDLGWRKLERGKVLKVGETWKSDLVYFSTQISLGFWRRGMGSGRSAGSSGNRVHLNPNATYVTTEDYVNDLGKFDPEAGDLVNMFAKEVIL